MKKTEMTSKKSAQEDRKDASEFTSAYKKRAIIPADKYDVISFAKAMNPDMAAKVKELFETEKEAAFEALNTGVYVSWRLPKETFDCQRVSSSSSCFCDHTLRQHHININKPNSAPCTSVGCGCKRFNWVPSKPEEMGEYWLRRRRGFKAEQWKLKCKCKHHHNNHHASLINRCSLCACREFRSSSLCAACDKHWEEHETFIEGEDDRAKLDLPIGDKYIPFSEIASLKNMVLTGKDDQAVAKL